MNLEPECEMETNFILVTQKGAEMMAHFWPLYKTGRKKICTVFKEPSL